MDAGATEGELKGTGNHRLVVRLSRVQNTGVHKHVSGSSDMIGAVNPPNRSTAKLILLRQTPQPFSFHACG